MTGRWHWLDLFWIAGFFIFGCAVLDKFLRPIGLDNVAYFLFYGITALLFVLSGQARSVIFNAPVLCLIIVLPLASTLWSIDPKLTLVRGAELLGSSLFGLLAGWYLTPEGLIRRLAAGLSLMTLGSFFVIFAMPSLGVAQDEAWGGTWVGLSQHKNGLGGTASLAVMVLFYAWLIGPGRWLSALMLVLSLILLAGSKSATSQLVTVMALSLALFVWLYQVRPRIGGLVIGLGLCLIPLIAWGFFHYDIGPMLVGLMGKDTTLGSRMGIWQLVWPYIGDRWWLGYGYGAFWQPDLPWVDQVTARLRFTPFYSHNGIVELWLGGGLVIVILSLLIYLQTFLKSLVPVIAEKHHWHHAFALVFMATFAFRNVTEAAVLTRNDMSWILFVAIAAAMARDVQFRFWSRST